MLEHYGLLHALYLQIVALHHTAILALIVL